MSYKFVYLLTRLDNLNIFLKGIIIISLVTIVILGLVTLFYFIEEEENIIPKVKNYIVSASIILFIFSLINIAVPTTKEAAVIYLLPKIVNNEESQKVPQNMLKLLNTKMEAWINEQIKTDNKAIHADQNRRQK